MIIKRKRSNILLLRFRKYLAIRNLERFLIKLFRISYKTIFTFIKKIVTIKIESRRIK